MASRTGPRLDPDGLDTLIVLIGGAASATGFVLLRVLGLEVVAAATLAAIPVAFAVLIFIWSWVAPSKSVTPMVDWSLVRAVAAVENQAIAITDRDGALVCTNSAFEEMFGTAAAPPELPVDALGRQTLKDAFHSAWRDGEALIEGATLTGRRFTGSCQCRGQEIGCLIWRFTPVDGIDALALAMQSLGVNDWGNRLGEAGIMAALVGGEGGVRAANRPLALRAAGKPGPSLDDTSLVDLLSIDAGGTIRFSREGPSAQPVRLIQVPLEQGVDDGPRLILLLDEDEPKPSGNSDAALHTLLSMLPVGLGLSDSAGRLLYLNQAFMRAAGIAAGTLPVYPSDLVVAEDKALVADAVRRLSLGQLSESDLAVRLIERPDEPIALGIAGARGLGAASVLLSLRDNSEESRLKREVAQATKMQAVGQLAGGVAHDFNNILTGIIGHCDLMLMRHSPGDSDYDDIQQIRINSNRAAGLTRQLLAFSRQQTLRPQILQLPDVVSEVSNLLKRLLGETIDLVISHGRGIGAVRADPGQLEQVIVNLAVNARDAMPDGGRLSLQTYAVSAEDVRRIGSDVLPISDYVALKMSDTGEGIPPDIVPKIFEPFFTTKEVGKGTGLGLSTVYGIVKQSGGFIFVNSEPGHGTAFTLYLPLHAASAEQIEATPSTERPRELWGSGHVLLVEDEAMVRVIAERSLTRHGYTVTTASNGEEALDLLDRIEAIDLLISDVVMPIMDGPTLVRQVRERYPKLPILFMSGYAEEQLRRSINIEKVRFLPKPFSVKQLAEAAQQALQAVSEK